jgi:hypothetical protein
MRTIIMLAIATLALAVGPAPVAAKSKKSNATVTVVNQSNWDIHELYLSSVDDGDWGPDQLGAFDIIESGARWQIRNIPCGRYDVKLVDEDQDECIVGDVAICGANDTWVITNEDLLACQLLTH